MQKAIKDRLKMLERENRILTENLVDAVYVINADTMQYEYFYPAGIGIGGFTDAELIGKSIYANFTSTASSNTIEVLNEELRSYKFGKHRARSIELELVHKKGHSYWVEIRAKLLKEHNGTIRIVGIAKDITARKKSEKQLKELNRQLATALAEKEKLEKEVKMLQGLLPICSACKRIRDDKGRWWPIEAYVREHTDSDFTHTICEGCKDVIYPDLKR